MEGVGSTHAHYGTLCACIFSHIFLKAIDELTYRRNEGGVNALVEICFFIACEYRNSKRSELLVAINGLDKVYSGFKICHGLVSLKHKLS